MLRYVRPDLLEQFNARDFDSFAANFGQVVQDMEETEAGISRWSSGSPGTSTARSS